MKETNKTNPQKQIDKKIRNKLK